MTHDVSILHHTFEVVYHCLNPVFHCLLVHSANSRERLCLSEFLCQVRTSGQQSFLQSRCLSRLVALLRSFCFPLVFSLVSSALQRLQCCHFPFGLVQLLALHHSLPFSLHLELKHACGARLAFCLELLHCRSNGKHRSDSMSVTFSNAHLQCFHLVLHHFNLPHKQSRVHQNLLRRVHSSVSSRPYHWLHLNLQHHPFEFCKSPLSAAREQLL
mmetsp:Transcript_4284/g.6298  ORF Transcript_4284/g.6298 Transcript_4284/m.6298 type:complete len:214 (-) Transcript_4284:1346-1987(-)